VPVGAARRGGAAARRGGDAQGAGEGRDVEAAARRARRGRARGGARGRRGGGGRGAALVLARRAAELRPYPPQRGGAPADRGDGVSAPAGELGLHLPAVACRSGSGGGGGGADGDDAAAADDDSATFVPALAPGAARGAPPVSETP